MTHDEFVGRVQNRAHLASRGDAEMAIRATLETLAERLEGGAADAIASQLPPEIGRHLKTDASFERMELDEFYKRVHSRERPSFELPDSVYHARVVLEMVREAVTPGAVEKVRAQLPDEFRTLFEAGSAGHMRADGTVEKETRERGE